MWGKQVEDKGPYGMESSLPLDDIRLKKKKSIQLNKIEKESGHHDAFWPC